MWYIAFISSGVIKLIFSDNVFYSEKAFASLSFGRGWVDLVSLVSFSKKKKTFKMGSRCVCVCVSVYVCVCVCVSVCVCVCVQFWSPPINFQTSYPIDTKFWLHIVSYRNSPTPLISFLNFENCARENFLNFIFFSI